MCRSTVTTRSAPADGEHVGDEARGDRLAAFGLAVLARVSVERAHRGDALRRRALRGVDHDQLLHEPVVDRVAVRLEHEHVGAADVLAVAAVDLAVRERREHDVAERDVQVLARPRSESSGGRGPATRTSFFLVTSSISLPPRSASGSSSRARPDGSRIAPGRP